MDTSVQQFAVAHLLRRPEVVETGGFVAGFDPDSTSPYINYATPLPGAEPTAADVAALVGEFRARGLRPRLEYAPVAAPAVEPALRAAGFTTEEEHVYLVCTPRTLTPPAAGGPKAAVPRDDAEYTGLDAALCEAFDGEFVPSPEGGARLRRTQEGGGGARLVRAEDGTIAGGGSCSPPAVGTSELAGVGTRPAHRGRGVASAVVASLTEAMFAAGAGSVWLEYSGAGSRRVYERLGYRAAGERLYISLP
ncbi:GNAT family N-acetyltransferase [Streptomyces sp. DW26H14]|uniref:GNAT family N-acetyltransferase n=1 Tax=Streptomyces sp. DW26H14 TaxID=3435395 RepID=UPI00403DE782